jgi:hypothetical protein
VIYSPNSSFENLAKLTSETVLDFPRYTDVIQNISLVDSHLTEEQQKAIISRRQRIQETFSVDDESDDDDEDTSTNSSPSVEDEPKKPHHLVVPQLPMCRYGSKCYRKVYLNV